MSATSVYRKGFSVLAAVVVALAASLLWGAPRAHAAGVQYVERGWNGSSVVSAEKTLSEGHVLLHDRVVASDGNGFALFDDRVFAQNSSVHWFYADRDETLRERCLVQGDVHLILADGVTITCNDGIGVPSGSSLTIYGQSGGTGKLVARADTNDYAAIGGEWRSSYHAGNITIHGGDITADAYNNNNGDDAAGIGGGYKGDGGTFTMYGGRVWAKGANGSLDGGAGIGGGREGNGGTVRIYGGEVIAYGGPDGAGIGGGDSRDCGSVEIYGGKVTATGGNAAAGIGGGEKASSGDIAIRGGEVTAAGGDEAAGIGGGNQGPAANSGTITISGGTVTATGGTNYGAGIGGGDQQSGGAINITGGESIVATGGKNAAGIGGGDQQSGGTITISGGAISETKGGENAAGIGGGGGASGGTITVSGGVITEVKGGENGAGIGSGYVADGDGGTITISGGVITKAQGGDNGAGIGGGGRASGGTITISAGSVTAVGGGGAGIGGGCGRISGVQSDGHGGTITISGGTVDATGGPRGAGIGGGAYGRSGTILITAGKVTANGGFPSGAGIGSGGRCNYLFGTTDITISGGEVRANGGAYENESIDYHNKRGAGIGAGGRLTVTFKGSTEERESTGSYFGGKIVFNGGTVYADELGASEDACLSGDNTDGVIEFNGGTVDVAFGHARADKITFGTHMRIRDVAAGERLSKCKSGEPFLVEPCDHAGSTIVDNGDGGTHKHYACSYCDLDAPNEPHAYGEPTSWAWSNDNTKATATAECACGYKKAFEAAVAPKASDPTVNVATAAIGGKSYTAEAERLVYAITASGDARGTVEVAKTAKVGSTVTVTATPARHCQLVSVSADGIPLTEESGAYRFTMPKKDVAVSAVFKGEDFQVTWKNYDGSVLASGLVEYGTTPTYGGATPTRPNDARYAYTFAGWEPEVAPVSGDTVYTAAFDAHWAADCTFKPLVNNYEKTVRFNGMDWYVIADGSESETSGTVTLLKKDLLEDEVQFDPSWQVARYADAEIRRRVDALTAPGGRFEAVAHAIADTDLPDVGVTGAKLYLISKEELDKLNWGIKNPDDNWWTRSRDDEALVSDLVWVMKTGFLSGPEGVDANERHGLRPALRLDLGKAEYVEGTGTFLVKQEVTAPTPAEGLIATGQELDLVTSPAVLVKGNTQGAITYSLDGQNWGTFPPKAKDPGDYTVHYRVAGNGVFAEHVGSVKVAVKLVPQGSFETTYGKTLADVALPAGWEWADNSLSVGSVGTRTFKANYVGPDFPRTDGVDVEVTVKRAANSATVSIGSWTYGQVAAQPQVTADFGADTATVEYKAKDADDGAYATAAPDQAGDYTVRATVPETTNYGGGACTADFSIVRKKVSATVTAENKTYDGTAAASVSATVSEGVLAGDAVTVAGLSGSFADANAGEGKTVNIDRTGAALIGRGAANYEVAIPETATAAIGKRPVSVKADDKSSRHGEGLAALTYDLCGSTTLAGGDALESLGVKASTVATSSSDAGEYPITLSGGTANPNYDVTLAGDGTYTITKAAIEPSVTLEGWTYGDAAITPSVSGNSGEGVVTYEYKARDADDGTYTEGVPTQVGDYTVCAVVPETTNYEGGACTADFSIARRPVSVKADDKSSRHGETIAELTCSLDGTSKLAGGDALDSLGVKASTTATSSSDAGEYPITLSGGTANPNYDVTLAGDGTYTIEKAQGLTKSVRVARVISTNEAGAWVASIEQPLANMMPSDAGVLGYEAGAPKYKGGSTELPDGVMFTHKVDTSTGVVTAKLEIPSTAVDIPDAVQEITLPVTVASKNYEDSTISVVMVPTKRDEMKVTITSIPDSVDYGDGTFTLTATAKDAQGNAVETKAGDWYWYSSDPAVLAVPEIANPNTDSSTVTVTVGKPGSAQILAWYEPSGGTTIGAALTDPITVNKKGIKPSVSISGWTYGEAPKAPVLAGGSNPGGCTVTYEYKAKGADDSAYTENVPTRAGNYTVRATVPESTNYEGATCTADFTIARKQVTAAVTAEDKTYDGKAAASVSASVGEGVLEGDSVTVAGISGTFADANAGEGKTVAIDRTGVAFIGRGAANYDVTIPEAATAAIEKRKATVKAGTFSKTYGEQDPELTATVSNAVDGDALRYTLSREEGEDAGEYAISVVLGDNPNYDVQAAGGKLSIAKAAIEPSVALGGWTYGEATNEPSVSGNPGGGEVTYEYKARSADDGTYIAAVPAHAGDYTVRATVPETRNHEGGACTADFAIARRPVSVKADDKSSCHGETIAPLTCSLDGATALAGGDALDSLGVKASTTATSSSDVGAYAITLSGGTANPDYDVTLAGGGTYTITKADRLIKSVRVAGRMSSVDDGGGKYHWETSIEQSLAGMMPGDAGELTYAAGAPEYNGGATALPAGVTFTYGVDPSTGKATARLEIPSTADDVPDAAREITLPVTVTSKNYERSTISVVVAPTKRDEVAVTIAGVPESVAYGDGPFTLTATAKDAQGNVVATEAGDWYWYSSDPSVLAVASQQGSNEMSVTVKSPGSAQVLAWYEPSGGNAIGAAATDSVTVGKASITPSVALAGWTYGDAANAPGVSGNPGGGAVTYEYKARGADDGAYIAAVPARAGDYTVRATVAETTNYKGNTCTADFTIARKQVSATVTAEGKTYDGTTAASVSATVREGVLEGDSVTVTGINGTFADASAGEAKEVAIDRTDAALIGRDAANYEVAIPETATAAIGKRPVSVKADDKSSRHGETTAPLTYGPCDSTTLAEGDALESLGVKASTTATSGSDVGAYPIELSGGTANPDYDVTLAGGGTYTIAKAQGLAKSIRVVGFVDSVDQPSPHWEADIEQSLAGAMPGDAGELTYAAGAPAYKGGATTLPDGVTFAYHVDPSTGEVTARLEIPPTAEDIPEEVQEITLPVTVRSKNYEDSIISVVVAPTKRDEVAVAIAGAPESVAYDSGPFTLTAAVTDPGTGASIETEAGDWYWYSSDPDVLAVASPQGSNEMSVTVKGVGSAQILAWYEPSGGTAIGAAATDSITVDKAEIKPSVALEGWTYGETAKTPSVSGNTGGGAVAYEYKAEGAEDSAYTATAPDQAGDYTVRATVAETDSYKGGTCTADFAIARRSIAAAGSSGAQVTLEQTSYPYDGTAKEPAVTSVVLGGKKLEEGTDYAVSYEDNVSAGTARAVVTGKGNYTGAAEATFTIVAPAPVTPVTPAKTSIEGAKVTLGQESYTCDGTAKEPAVKVELGGKELVAGGDYDVAYEDNVEVGTATAVVTGKGAYEGTVKATFSIVEAKTPDQPGDNPGDDPGENPGGDSGEPGAKADIAKAQVTLAKSRLAYDGTAKRPAARVVLGGKELVAGADYELTYEDNTNAGTATATVTGKGAYTGAKAVTFKIAKAKNALTVKTKKKAVRASGKARTVKPIAKATPKYKAKVTFAKAKSAKAKKLSGYRALSVNKKTGKVRVRANAWPGTYKLMVKVTAAKTANTKLASKKVVVTVKVKPKAKLKAASATAPLTAAAAR